MAEKDKLESRKEPGGNWLTEKTESIKEFYTETRHEMQRVTWPTRKQVQGTTIVVIITVFFFGAFFMVSDSIVGFLIDLIYKKLATHS